MELLEKKIKPIYFKYLVAAFGSALVSSIYSMVDMIVVGKYEGPNGTAALAVIAPVWNILYSLGLLTGIGGSVLYSLEKGKEEKNSRSANSIFTISVLMTFVFAIISWVLVICFDTEMLMLFGAEKTLLPFALEYLKPLKFVVPVFIFNQMLAAFLRNDNNPQLATIAVLATGILNAVGDYIFVFPMKMGIRGAGLATAISAAVSTIIMLTHFISKKNTLKFVKPERILSKVNSIFITGFSTFFVDIAMGILTMLLNRQILRYAGTDALSIYGIIVNISTIVQCCAYSVGQASQPIISINFGAKQWQRIKETLKYSLLTIALFSFIATAVALAFPEKLVHMFMTPTQNVLAIAPTIIRQYCVSFLFLPLNIYSTYYFQSILKPGISFIISVSRGLVIGGILIMALPAIFGVNMMWFAMPITEVSVAIFVVVLIVKYTKRLKR